MRGSLTIYWVLISKIHYLTLDLKPLSLSLESQIETLLENFEPRIAKTDVEVRFEPDSNELFIKINYEIVGLPVPAQEIEFILEPTRI